MIRKLTILVLSAVMLVSVTACNQSSNDSIPTKQPEPTPWVIDEATGQFTKGQRDPGYFPEPMADKTELGGNTEVEYEHKEYTDTFLGFKMLTPRLFNMEGKRGGVNYEFVKPYYIPSRPDSADSTMDIYICPFVRDQELEYYDYDLDKFTSAESTFEAVIYNKLTQVITGTHGREITEESFDGELTKCTVDGLEAVRFDGTVLVCYEWKSNDIVASEFLQRIYGYCILDKDPVVVVGTFIDGDDDYEYKLTSQLGFMQGVVDGMVDTYISSEHAEAE